MLQAHLVGADVVLKALGRLGMLLLDESTAPGRLLSIGLVVFGLAGLGIFSGE